MSSKKKDKYLILATGEEVKVTKEKGNYFICENRQFRKTNPEILKVESRAQKEKDKPVEEEPKEVEEDA